MTEGGKWSPPFREVGGCQSGGDAGLMRGGEGNAVSMRGNGDVVGAVEANSEAITGGEVCLTGLLVKERVAALAGLKPSGRKEMAPEISLDSCMAGMHGIVHVVNNSVAGDCKMSCVGGDAALSLHSSADGRPVMLVMLVEPPTIALPLLLQLMATRYLLPRNLSRFPMSGQ